jgi:hypothetical protein
MYPTLKIHDLKLSLVRTLIVAVPSFTVASLTESMPLVVPTIALTMMVASSVETGSVSNRNRLDEESGDLTDVLDDAGDVGTMDASSIDGGGI